MVYEEVNVAVVILGDHKYEILSKDEMEEGYYTVLRDDGVSFIISCNEDGEWESLEPIDPFLVTKLGALIDENEL